ncbi:extracellular solute-binding protein [Agreia sp.]|uniref:extracellular solute-binding protein n=1 Tax=Agreia sp. TaxID=1872416 RepID=UPI0035BC1138
MNNRLATSHRKWITGVIAVTAASLALAGCSASTDSSSESGGNITLKLAAFGDATQVKVLAEQYSEKNPNITVEVAAAANAGDARTSLLTKLAAKTGLADVEQLEVSWIGELAPYSSSFNPVVDDGNGGWLASQAEPVTKDGELWAYGAGAGPMAICYHADALAAAGMPSEPDAVAEMLGTSWDDYFAAGEKFAAAGGAGAWYDSAYQTYQAQLEQMPYPYEDADDKIVVDNPEVEAIFKNSLKESETLSARLIPFSEDWMAGMGSSAYATIACPTWMLGMIEGNSADVTDWRVANSFPGGGGNAGGSYYAVPAVSEHPKEAAALAAWLTAPEQQIALFMAGGAFPSREEALTSPDLTTVTNAFFGDASVGEIFADRSKAINVVTYKGPNFLAIDTVVFDAMSRVEAGQQSTDDAWDQIVKESKALAD